MRKSFNFVLFWVLAVMSILYVSSVLRRKYRQGVIAQRIYDDSSAYDVLCCGSSHAYCTINPMEIYRERGLRTGVIATRRQPLECTYYYLKEAFARKQPKVILLESYMIYSEGCCQDEAVLHDAIVAFPGLANKFRMVEAALVAGNREDFYFDLLKYHSRWQELTSTDYTNELCISDFLHGYVAFTKKTPVNVGKENASEHAVREIPRRKLAWLLKIRDLVHSHGGRLVVFTAPYDFGKKKEELLGQISALAKFLKRERIEYVDFFKLFSDVGLDASVDFYDPGHLNIWGAQKVSRWICGYLNQDAHSDVTKSDWDADLVEYGKFCINEGVVDFKIGEGKKKLKNVASIGEVRILPKDEKYNFVKLPVELMADRMYLLRAKSVKFTHGSAKRLHVKLRNNVLKKDVASVFFPLVDSGGIEIPFAVPNGGSGCALYVFAGDPKAENGCRGVGVVLDGVTVDEVQQLVDSKMTAK